MTERFSTKEIGDALLEYLQRKLKEQELSYAEEPSRTKSGVAPIYAFRLHGAQPPFDKPLSARVYRRFPYPDRPAREQALHAAVRQQGYPAPLGLLPEPGDWAIGKPLLILERIDGDLMEGRMTDLRTALRAPRLFAHMLARLHALDGGTFLDSMTSAGVPGFSLTVGHQLERVSERAEEWQRPASQWLLDNAPKGLQRLVPCHGEMRPESIVLRDGNVNWVIEWGNAKIAAPEFDAGHTMFELLHQPLLPAALRPFAGLTRRWMRARFYAAYRRQRATDDEAVQYYEAFRLFREMVDRPKKSGALVQEFRDMTGIALDGPTE